MKLTIYTDGSCNNRVEGFKYGGFSCIIDGIPDGRVIITGGSHATTSARMELVAVASAMIFIVDSLLKIPEGYILNIKTDSEYIVNSINKGWLWDWQAMHFANTKNTDVWKTIIKCLKSPKITGLIIEHVRGHSGIELNELADKLANSARDTMRDKFVSKDIITFTTIKQPNQNPKTENTWM